MSEYEQLELGPARKVRTTDPDTSHAAAIRSVPRWGTQRHRLLEVLDAWDRPWTSQELSDRSGLRLDIARTRLSELHQAGQIEVVDVRDHQSAYRITAQGRRDLRSTKGTPDG